VEGYLIDTVFRRRVPRGVHLVRQLLHHSASRAQRRGLRSCMAMAVSSKVGLDQSQLRNLPSMVSSSCLR
jgi:hypothetical protein